jgi:hypothetical protein
MASASTGGVPEEMTSVWRLLNFPPIPEVPEPLRGKSFTAIEAIYCGDPVDGEELVGPLREFGSVAMDSVAVQPPAGIAELHMDPPEPVPYWGDSILIGELPAAAIDSLLEAVGPGSGSQLLSVELRHCGGALSRTSPSAGALATLPGSFFAFGVGLFRCQKRWRGPGAGWAPSRRHSSPMTQGPISISPKSPSR